MTTPRRPKVDIRAMIGACEAAHLSRAEIARRTGLARSTVTMLATGERGRAPSFQTVEAIRELFAIVNK